MPRKNTKNIATLNAQHAESVPVFFPDLSTIASLPCPAGISTEYPTSIEGGLWWLSVPAGKTVWLHHTPMTPAEEADFALLQERGLPITGPIYFPMAFDQGEFGHLVPDGAEVIVHLVRQKNEGAQ